MTAETLVQSCLARITEREPVLKAWQYLGSEAALARARALDAAGPGGPLKGIPIGVKDLIDTIDMPTRYGSPLYDGHRPARDASCVSLIRRLGGVVIGKTVTTELAFFHPGPTTNPVDPRHTPGGSSSGSAAAVAAGMVPLALGTQTAGSIIRPASFCGCVGFKPSFGLLDRTGIHPLAESLDTLGAFATTVTDVAWFIALLARRPALLADKPPPPRIGLCRLDYWSRADADMLATVEHVADQAAESGAQIIEITPPDGFNDLAESQTIIMAYEAARALAPDMDFGGDRTSEPLRRLVQTGEAITAVEYDLARARAARADADLRLIFGGVDALLAPSAIGAAPLASAGTGDPLFNRVWTLLGVPCISLPLGRSAAGLPLGVQVIGARGEDGRCLAVAAWLEGLFA